MSAQKHLYVVGAGIVGTATALNLLRDGHRVTLIDRGPPGEGTSFGNAAVIEPHGVIPVPSPGRALAGPALPDEPARSAGHPLELPAAPHALAGALRLEQPALEGEELDGSAGQAAAPDDRGLARAAGLDRRGGHDPREGLARGGRDRAGLACLPGADRGAPPLRRAADRAEARGDPPTRAVAGAAQLRGRSVLSEGRACGQPLAHRAGAGSGGTAAGCSAGARRNPRLRAARREGRLAEGPRAQLSLRRRHRHRRRLVARPGRGAGREGAARHRARLSRDAAQGRRRAAPAGAVARGRLRRHAAGARPAHRRDRRAGRSQAAAELAARRGAAGRRQALVPAR